MNEAELRSSYENQIAEVVRAGQREAVKRLISDIEQIHEDDRGGDRFVWDDDFIALLRDYLKDDT